MEYTQPTLQQLKKRKTAFIAMTVVGSLVGIGAGIAMSVQTGNPAGILMAPFVVYQFAAFVAGFLTFPKFNAVFGKLLAIPFAGWAAALVVLYIGLCIWAIVGLFTLPHQVKKLKRELAESEKAAGGADYGTF